MKCAQSTFFIDRDWINEKERAREFSAAYVTVGAAIADLLKVSGISDVKDVLDLVESRDTFEDQLNLYHPLVVVLGCDKPFIQRRDRYSWHLKKHTRAVHLLDAGPKDASRGSAVFLFYDVFRNTWRAYHAEEEYEKTVMEAIRRYKDPPSKDVSAQQSIKRIIEEGLDEVDDGEIDSSEVPFDIEDELEDDDEDDRGDGFPHTLECRCEICVLGYRECAKHLSHSGWYD